MGGLQIVYCSPMTHGPFSSLRSISSKHSVMVAHTLRFIASIAAGDALCRQAAPRFAGHRRFFRDAERNGSGSEPEEDHPHSLITGPQCSAGERWAFDFCGDDGLAFLSSRIRE